MVRLGLPNELLCSITEHLKSEKDINAFARTNRRLHGLLNTDLYRHNVRWSGSSALLWAMNRGKDTTALKLLGEGPDVRVTIQKTTDAGFAWTPMMWIKGGE